MCDRCEEEEDGCRAPREAQAVCRPHGCVIGRRCRWITRRPIESDQTDLFDRSRTRVRLTLCIKRVSYEDLIAANRAGAIDARSLELLQLERTDIDKWRRAANVRANTEDIADTLSGLAFSGCGKSTLLFVVAGLLTPTRGKVRLDHAPLPELADLYERIIGGLPGIRAVSVAERTRQHRRPDAYPQVAGRATAAAGRQVHRPRQRRRVGRQEAVPGGGSEDQPLGWSGSAGGQEC